MPQDNPHEPRSNQYSPDSKQPSTSSTANFANHPTNFSDGFRSQPDLSFVKTSRKSEIQQRQTLSTATIGSGNDFQLITSAKYSNNGSRNMSMASNRLTDSSVRRAGYMEMDELMSPNLHDEPLDDGASRGGRESSEDTAGLMENGDSSTPRPRRGRLREAKLPEGTSTILAAVLNFTNSIVGAGIIGIQQ
jgi:hypothetical protein